MKATNLKQSQGCSSWLSRSRALRHISKPFFKFHAAAFFIKLKITEKLRLRTDFGSRKSALDKFSNLGIGRVLSGQNFPCGRKSLKWPLWGRLLSHMSDQDNTLQVRDYLQRRKMIEKFVDYWLNFDDFNGFFLAKCHHLYKAIKIPLKDAGEMLKIFKHD